MTLSDMKACEKEFLTPTDVAGVIRCKPYSLNLTVKNGGTLPFDYIMVGTRLKFPRLAFIAWAERTKIS